MKVLHIYRGCVRYHYLSLTHPRVFIEKRIIFAIAKQPFPKWAFRKHKKKGAKIEKGERRDK